MEGALFKIVPAPLWRASEASGRFTGSPVDVRDGFIHLSTGAQVYDAVERLIRRGSISESWAPAVLRFMGTAERSVPHALLRNRTPRSFVKILGAQGV